MSHSYGTIRKVCNKVFTYGFSYLNSHNTPKSVSDEQTKFLNQRETFCENHFHFDFMIYVWS